MFLDYSICVGLYAYLNQLGMSLDRALPNDIEGLRMYFSSTNTYSPRYVAKRLESLVGTRKEIVFIYYNGNRLLSRMIFRNKLVIKSNELLAITYSIFRIHELMHELQLDTKACVSMRMFLYSINQRVIGSRLKKSSRINADRVEHYNQNNALTLKSIDTILGHKWI